MQKPLAISILNWNGLAYTVQCIDAVLNSSYKDLDIIVLDNGSTENEAIQLERRFGKSINIIRCEENKGFAGGHNYIMRQYPEYEYYLLLNQDAILDAACIQVLMEHITTHENIAVVGPAIYNTDYSVQSAGADINLYTGKVISKKIIPTEPVNVDCVIGACFLISTQALKNVGYFDEAYFAYYEEADWCVRARNHDYKCVVVPQAKAHHAKSGGFRTYFNMRNMIWFEKKHATLSQRIVFIFYYPLFMVERLKKGSPFMEICKASLHGWFNLRKGKAK